jgi:heat-inducible transcriptional repressor
MFSHVDLTHRQQYILKATVQHYIATAEPVGSKALVDDLSVSSATIRSVMGVLEKAGLLYQPHTSAGRIPSDFGYRLYVDELITPSHSQAEQAFQLLGKKLNWESWSIEALLREAAKILSNLSGYITLITLPQTSHSRLRHLQIVRVDRWRVMLILITDTYETQSTLMELPAAIEDETNPTLTDEAADEAIDRELQILSNFLNTELRGRLLTDLSQLDWNELDREFQRYADALTKLLGDLTRQFKTPIATRMTIGGVAQVLRQPEFAELHQVQPLLQCLESEPDRILPLLSVPAQTLATNRRVTVRIGAENPLEPMRTCTLISANYHRDSVPVGSVGVLGPTRMLYENTIAIVAAAADYLSQTLSEN